MTPRTQQLVAVLRDIQRRMLAVAAGSDRRVVVLGKANAAPTTGVNMKGAKARVMRLNGNDVALLRAARKARAYFRPHREAEATLRVLLERVAHLPADGNTWSCVTGSPGWLAALLQAIEEAAAKTRRTLEQRPDFYEPARRRYLREFHAEARQPRRAA